MSGGDAVGLVLFDPVLLPPMQAALGVGVISLPFCSLLLGVVPGAAALAAAALATWYSCHCLAMGAQATGQRTFSGTLVAALGRWAGGLSQALLAPLHSSLPPVLAVCPSSTVPCDLGGGTPPPYCLRDLRCWSEFPWQVSSSTSAWC